MIDFNHPVRKVDAVGLGALVAMTALAWLGLVRPADAVRDAAEQRLVELADQQGLKLAAEAEVRELQTRIANARELAGSDSGRSRPVSELNARLAELIADTEASGLRADGVEPGEVTPDGSAIRVPIEMAGTGSYPRLTSFLNDLYERRRDITVTRIDVRRGSDGSAAFELGLTWWTTPG
jgi:Tfp pilus assembly protein PilO